MQIEPYSCHYPESNKEFSQTNSLHLLLQFTMCQFAVFLSSPSTQPLDFAAQAHQRFHQCIARAIQDYREFAAANLEALLEEKRVRHNILLETHLTQPLQPFPWHTVIDFEFFYGISICTILCHCPFSVQNNTNAKLTWTRENNTIFSKKGDRNGAK